MISPSLSLTNSNNEVEVRALNTIPGNDPDPSNNTFRLDLPCPDDQEMFLVIQPDDFGSDILWKIKNEANQIVAQGGPYEDFNTQIIKVPVNLENGCYKLIMRDLYGDGLCCDYGEGWYRMEDQTGLLLIESDGYYGFKEVQSFCLGVEGAYRRLRERDKKLSARPGNL